MDFMNFPTDWGTFTQFITWLGNQGAGLIFTVWVLNFLFSTVKSFVRALAHNGGRML